VDGQLWWESDTGILALRYNDGNSTQWVAISEAGPPRYRDASMTFSPPALTAGGFLTQQVISVPGAVVGDFVLASFSQPMGGAVISAWVNAANNVTFAFSYAGGGTLNLFTGTVRVRVWAQ
jgi:hypothetical protein